MKILSKNIKVYPTAYRGTYNTTDPDTGVLVTKVYNPASRLFTEENVTNIFSNLVDFTETHDQNKHLGSFVISKTANDNPFKFVLAGYYFEIENSTSIFTDNTKVYYATIKVKNKGLNDFGDKNVTLYTNYLSPLSGNDNSLDVSQNQQDTFMALDITTDQPSFTGDDYHSLILVDKGQVPETSLLKYDKASVFGGINKDGEYKSLPNLLRTNDIIVQDVITDEKADPDTNIDFVESNEKIQTIDATTSVTTPLVQVNQIQPVYDSDVVTESNNLSITATGEINVVSTDHLNLDSSEGNVQISTYSDSKNIQISSAGNVSITGSSNNQGAYVVLKSGSAPSESYILPTSDEPSDFSSDHILATREWVTDKFDITSAGTTYGLGDTVTVYNGDTSKTFTVEKTEKAYSADRSSTIYLNDGSSGTKYLVVCDSATGAAKKVYKSTIAISGSAITSCSNITASGTIQADHFNATSDIRLKENIKTYEPHRSILDLPVVEFDFKSSGKHTIGCIAQDLQEICPEIVHEGEDGFLSIEESKIVYLLLEEVKKLREEVNELKK